jgi:hypothetical protein
MANLRGQYWNEPRVGGKPIVFAIESFAFEGSLHFASNALASYLYGLRPRWHHDEHGRLHVSYVTVEGFRANDVERPANFFGRACLSPPLCRQRHRAEVQPDLLSGRNRARRPDDDQARDAVRTRSGRAARPAPVSYEVGNRMETWGEGIEVFHNPNAVEPLPSGVFPDAVDHRLEDGPIVATIPLSTRSPHSLS